MPPLYLEDLEQKRQTADQAGEELFLEDLPPDKNTDTVFLEDIGSVGGYPANMSVDELNYRVKREKYADPEQNFFGYVRVGGDLVKNFVKGFGSFALEHVPKSLIGLASQVAQRPFRTEISDYVGALAGSPLAMNEVMQSFNPAARRRNEAQAEAISKSALRLSSAVGNWAKSSGLKPDEGKPNEVAFDIGSGSASLLSSIGLAYLSKGGTLAAASFFGAMQTGDTFQKAEQAGKSFEQARAIAMVTGLGEGALEFAGLEIWTKFLRGSKTIARTMLRGADEFGQEFLQQLSQDTIAKISAIDKKEWGQIFMDAGYAGLLGLAIGTPVGGIQTAIENRGAIGRLRSAGLNDAEINAVVELMQEKAVRDNMPEIQRTISDEAAKFDAISQENAEKEAGAAPGVKIDVPQLPAPGASKTPSGTPSGASPTPAGQETDATQQENANGGQIPEAGKGEKEPKTPEQKAQEIAARGRVKALASEQQGVLDQIDALDEEKERLVEEEKSTAKIDEELDGLAERYDAIDAEIGEILTTIGVQIEPGADIEITAGELVRQTLQTARQAEKESKLDIKSVQQGFADIIRTAPLSNDDKIKFLSALTNANSIEEFAKMAPEIEDRISRLEEAAKKRKAFFGIKSSLRQTKTTKQAGKPVGKFTPEIQEILDSMRKASRLTKTQAEDQLNRNLDAIGDKMPTIQQTLENRVLDAIANRKTLSSKDLQETLDIVNSLATTGKIIRLMQATARAEAIDAVKKSIVAEITGGKGIKPEHKSQGIQDKDKTRNAAMKWLVSLERDNVAWVDILSMLSVKAKGVRPGESVTEKFGDVTEEIKAEKRGTREWNDRLTAAGVKAYGISQEQLVKKLVEHTDEKSLGVFVFSDGTTQELRFTKDEAIKRWMELSDPTLLMTFMDPDGNAYTDQVIGAISNFLTAEDKAFAQGQIEAYREYYKTVNPIYRSIYGVNLPFNPFYSPIKRGDIDRDMSEGFGAFMQEQRARASVTSGSLKSRVKNIRPIERRGSVAVFQQHIVEMERFKNWASKIRDLSAVFGDGEVRSAIAEFHGTGMISAVDEMLRKFTRTGAERAGRHEWIDNMRINFTKSVLPLKLPITLKQFSSFLAFAEFIPVADFAEGVADFNVAHAKILMQSEVVKERAGNIDRDIRDATNSDAYRFFRENPSFVNALRFNMVLGDRAAILFGGWPIYRYWKNKGLSHEEALKKFEAALSSTQQSSDIDQQSLFQQGTSLNKALSMFLSAPNQYMRREIAAIRNLKAGRIKPPEAAKIIFIYHILLPMIVQWISDAFRFRPERQLRAAILGNINGIFVVGQMLEAVVDFALSGKKRDVSTPVLGMLDGAVEGMSKLTEKDVSIDDIFEAFKGFGEVAGGMTGIPVKTFVEWGETVYEAYEQEYALAIGGALGWSDRALKPGKKSKNTVKFK